jgi:hypothetical protein
VDQGRRKLAGRKTGEERRLSKIVSTSNPGEQLPGFFYAWIIINNKDKAQATR